MDEAEEEVLGSMHSFFSQVLRALPATFLPIYGFWATTLPYMKKYAEWYSSTSKPSSLDELADTGLLRGLVKADKQVLELTCEVRALERRLDAYKSKRKSNESVERRSIPQTPSGVRRLEATPSQEDKYKQKLIEVLKTKKEKLTDASAKAQDLANSICAYWNETDHTRTQEDERPEEFSLPKIYWIKTGTNVGVGLASFLVWDASYGFEDSSLPLVAYGTQLALYWTYYPILFHFGSYEWSLIHISLATIASVITTIEFTKQSSLAGLLMMPYLFYMAYSVHHNYTVGIEDWNQRGMNQKVSQLLRRYCTEPSQSTSH